MNKLLTFVILCMSLMSLEHKAQNYREDILAVNKTLLSQKNYSLQLNYHLFLDGDLTRTFQHREVKIVRQGANLYMKQNAEIEMIVTKNYQFLIDHLNKIFSASEKKGVERNKEQFSSETYSLLTTYVDTIVSVFEKIKVVLNTDKVIKYECTLKANEEVSVIWVEIDKKLKFYRSLTTQYKQKTKVRELNNSSHLITLTVNYSGFNVQPAVTPATFNELNYVTMDRDKIKGLARKYRQYKYFHTSLQ